MLKNPNPQGKGLVPQMALLMQSRHLVSVLPKSIGQISSELFTSLFILESRFSFKPVVAKPYWLYYRHPDFRLSLVSPDEWGGNAFGKSIGRCELHKDMSWTLNLSAEAMKDHELKRLIDSRKAQFEEKLKNASKVDDLLPVYVPGFSFYQRVYASAVAKSLSLSMQASSIAGLSYEKAMALECGTEAE